MTHGYRAQLIRQICASLSRPKPVHDTDVERAINVIAILLFFRYLRSRGTADMSMQRNTPAPIEANSKATQACFRIRANQSKTMSRLRLTHFGTQPLLTSSRHVLSVLSSS